MALTGTDAGKATLVGLLATTTKTVRSGKNEREPRAANPPARIASSSRTPDDIIDELVAARRDKRDGRDGRGGRVTTRRPNDAPRSASARKMYVLGERPAPAAAVPPAKRGCLKKLSSHKVSENSRRRLDPSKIESYNHFREYFEAPEDQDYEGGDRGEEVMEQPCGLAWERMGTMQQ